VNEGYRKMPIIIAVYIFLTVLALTFMKLGSGNSYFHVEKWVVDMKINLYLVAGMSLYVVSFILYAYIISKNDLSFIIALLSAFVTIAIILVGIFLFQEQITWFKGIGISLIVLGVVFINIKP
jgi:drug/metabolite transporter (DMT)-like permease